MQYIQYIQYPISNFKYPISNTWYQVSNIIRYPVLQADNSDPPDAYTAVVPDAEAGPGEQYYPIVPTAVRTLSNTWCLVPGNRIFGGTVIFFFSDNDK